MDQVLRGDVLQCMQQIQLLIVYGWEQKSVSLPQLAVSLQPWGETPTPSRGGTACLVNKHGTWAAQKIGFYDCRF